MPGEDRRQACEVRPPRADRLRGCLGMAVFGRVGLFPAHDTSPLGRVKTINLLWMSG